MDMDLAALRMLAKQIVQGYHDIEPVLNRACAITCPSCAEVCCMRATVWYDLKDLLVLYLAQGRFPKRQIYRNADNSCCNLTHSGCRLPRLERPFICTWYICPEQKQALAGLPGLGLDYTAESVSATMEKIQSVRKALEEAYIKAACNP